MDNEQKTAFKLEQQKNWQGITVFICQGKLMGGNPKDNKSKYLTMIMFCVFTIYFYSFMGKYSLESFGLGPLILDLIIFMLATYHLIACMYKDPGVILRGNLILDQNNQQDKNKEQENIILQNQYNVNINNNLNNNEEKYHQNAQNNITNYQPNIVKLEMQENIINKEPIFENQQQNQYLLINNMGTASEDQHIQKQQQVSPVKPQEKYEPEDKIQEKQNKDDLPHIYTERYCETCKIMRPPKASHCGFCQQCVKGFDHHCNWVGTCVGQRNWKNFVGFLFFLTLHIIILLVFCILTIVYLNDRFPEFFLQYYQDTTGFVLTVVFFSLLTCVSLCMRHSEEVCLLFLIILLGITFGYSFKIVNQNQMSTLDNPIFSILGICIFLMSFLTVGPICCLHLWNIKYGKNSKEISSYMRSKKLRQLKQETGSCQVIKNCFWFCTYEVDESEILI